MMQTIRRRRVLLILLACAIAGVAVPVARSVEQHFRMTSYCGRQGLGISCLARRFDRSGDHAGWVTQSFTSSNGAARRYILLQPDLSGPKPTVIVLHGVNGDGREAAVGSGLGTFAPEHGFVAVFPDSLSGLWNAFPPGKAPASVQRRSEKGGLGDDVRFLRDLVADLVRRGISDPRRVYLAGLSMGGFMALEMACADASDFAGVALLASSMPDVTGESCNPSKPLPFLMMNGTADRSVPYLGGDVGTSQYGVWSTDRTLAFFRRLDGCGQGETSAELPPLHPKQATRVTFREWKACATGRVGLYRIAGGEHEFPPIGIDAPAALIAFFNAN